MIFALLVSIPLGVLAALRRNSWIDYLCTGYTVAGLRHAQFRPGADPDLLFSIKLDWLPITGIGSSEAAAGGWWTYIRPFIIPAIALGTLQTAMLTRLLRSSMIDVLSQDYMRTARAKGLLPATIVVVHALKNAMIPFVTMAAVQFGYMIGIQVTIEYIFAVPGMGSAVLNAVVNRDFPVIQGFTLVIAPSSCSPTSWPTCSTPCSTRASGIERWRRPTPRLPLSPRRVSPVRSAGGAPVPAPPRRHAGPDLPVR